MSYTVPPDYLGACLAWLQQRLPPLFPAIQATEIKPYLPAATIKRSDSSVVAMPAYFVALVPQGGAARRDRLPQSRPRLDVWCFGPNALSAATLERFVYAVMEPLPPVDVGFTAAGCRVLDVHAEAQPLARVLPNTDWPVRWRPYRLTYQEVPV